MKIRNVDRLLSAAVAALLVGGPLIGCGGDEKKPEGGSGSGSGGTSTAPATSEKHVCKGMNSCKGNGGCKTT